MLLLLDLNRSKMSLHMRKNNLGAIIIDNQNKQESTTTYDYMKAREIYNNIKQNN